MDIQARHRYTGTGARKVRQVTRLLPGKSAESAMEILRNLPHVGARLTRKVLASAMANAEHNHKLDKESLFVKSILVNDAVGLRRFKPRAFGRADTMHRGSSHIIVILTTVAPKTKKKPEKKIKDIETKVAEPIVEDKVEAKEIVETKEATTKESHGS